jgi:hypothetical protein
VSRIDDHHGCSGLEDLVQAFCDALRQILLEHEPSREHFYQASHARQAGDTMSGEHGDMGLALCGEEMVRAYEHQREMRRDQRPFAGYRETPTNRALRRALIAGEQNLGKCARRSLGRRAKIARTTLDPERFEQIAKSAFDADE